MVEIFENYQLKHALSGGPIKQRQFEPSESPVQPNNGSYTFSKAFYGNSEYSLTRPNNRTDFVAQNIDLIA